MAAKNSETERAALEERVQMRLSLEKKAQEIVERLLDNPITEDFLLECAFSIYPQHYQDVVTERSIIKQCGYPLCQRSLENVSKQKYHISRKTNKVYDITERKCFCSQFCYKASKFYEAQLSDSPLWTREMEEPLDIKLLTRDAEADPTAASLIAKDNVVLTERIEPQEVDKAGSGEKDLPLKEEALGLLEDDLSNLTFADTWKRDRLQELAEMSRLSTPSHPKCESYDKSTEHQSRSECTELHVTTQPFSEEDDKISHAGELGKRPEGSQEQDGESREFKKEDVLQQVQRKGLDGLDSEHLLGNKTTDADQPKSAFSRGNVSANVQEDKKKKKKQNLQKSVPAVDDSPLLESVSKIIMEWITNETAEFLFGCTLPSQQPSLEETQNVMPGALATLDPLAPTSDAPLPPVKPLPGMEKLKEETKEFSLKVQEFYYGRHLDVTTKKEAAGRKDEKREEVADRAMRLPLIDSKSQMAIRRKILSDRLNRVYTEILGLLGLSMRDVSSDLQSLIRTFQLSSTNITFNPAGWTVLGILLLHLIAKRNALIRGSITKDESRRILGSLLVKMGASLEQLARVVRTVEQGGANNQSR